VIRHLVPALAAVFLAAAAPGQAFSQDKLRVVATSADLKSLVEAVGGERVAVESLASPGQDPHAIEVKPAQLARLRGAALLVRIGLDHEPWLAKIKLGENLAVVDASKNVRLLQTETPRLRVERKAHVHAYGNTHYWLDPHNAQPITASILQALAALSPADKGRFEKNRDAFLSRLNEKIGQWETAVKPYRGTKAVVIHDSWAYFAERFGLDIVAAAEPTPGVPPSPAELAALFKRMREAGVKLVIAEPPSNPSLVRQIEEKSGAKAVTLLPSGSDYLALFDENLRRLTAALKGS
jgi:ABC-type Zn uptake system ZnuABC Zn-binding protein ZnuA